jgi:hypothetical protein
MKYEIKKCEGKIPKVSSVKPRCEIIKALVKMQVGEYITIPIEMYYSITSKMVTAKNIIGVPGIQFSRRKVDGALNIYRVQ